MTSSLVGSEMCIRDSFMRSSRGPALASEAPKCSDGGGDSWRPHPAGTSAVSYTHLTLPTICSV
eukprot:6385199-Prorocentrum_lima.AAC.1